MRSKPFAAVVVAVAVVVLLGVAGTALLKKSKDTGKVNTAPAGAHLAEILDAIESAPTTLGACPFDGITSVLMAAPSDLRPAGWQAGSIASGFSDDHRRAITCVADGNSLRVDSVKLAVVIGEPRRGDVGSALRGAAGDLDWRQAPGVKFQDGEITAACATPKLKGLNPAPAYCTAVFNGPNLAIDLVSNAPAGTVDLAIAWLRESFAKVLSVIEATPIAGSTDLPMSPSSTAPTTATSTTPTALSSSTALSSTRPTTAESTVG